MTIHEATQEIIAVARSFDSILPHLKWCQFGSARSNEYTASDYDFLVIYRSVEEPNILRNALAQSCVKYPIHLMFLLEEEESELNFLTKEKCEVLWPVQ